MARVEVVEYTDCVCSTAWGADMEDDGKVVWFTPAPEPTDDPVEGILTGIDSPDERPRAGQASG